MFVDESDTTRVIKATNGLIDREIIVEYRKNLCENTKFLSILEKDY